MMTPDGPQMTPMAPMTRARVVAPPPVEDRRPWRIRDARNERPSATQRVFRSARPGCACGGLRPPAGPPSAPGHIVRHCSARSTGGASQDDGPASLWERTRTEGARHLRHLRIPAVCVAVVASFTGVAVTAQAPAWQEARPGYVFEFPRDHAAHPEFRIEWWYYTGNLDAADGRRFGYQVTFFRVGVDPAPANPSRWAVRDLYMTHVAVSDPAGRRYRYAERLNRGGPGIAGAATDRYHVWNDDWTAALDAEGRHVIRLLEDGLGVDLVLDETRPPTLNGRNGTSQKGRDAGNASHYYSLTRMPTRGTIVIDGERVAVTGLSWMDREFGTSFLEPDQQGWDWFALQLEDGSDLMIYQLRRGDGSRDPHSSGTLTRADGRVVTLRSPDFTLTPLGPVYRSPSSGATYPIAWRIDIPGEALSLDVTTPLPAQELDTRPSTGVTYWEGLVDATGRHRGRNVTGRGYLEMTGYAGSMGRVLSGQ
jgi:predicted secreted hydrolase